MLTLHPEERIWLDEYRRALAEQQPGAVARLLVYGSKARGNAHEDSDIDVLLLVKNEAEERKRVLGYIGYDLAATSYAVPSIMTYMQSEWDRLKALRSPYRETVERDGVDVL